MLFFVFLLYTFKKKNEEKEKSKIKVYTQKYYNYDELLKIYKQLLHRSQDNFYILLCIILLNIINSKEYRETFSYPEKAINTDKTNFILYNIKIVLLEKTTDLIYDYDEYLKTIDKSLAINPLQTKILYKKCSIVKEIIGHNELLSSTEKDLLLNNLTENKKRLEELSNNDYL